jgi:tmRNA-binding protein
MNQKVEIKNRKAKFEYEFLDVYTAGIKLTGTEIKSLRNHKARIRARRLHKPRAKKRTQAFNE